MRLIECNVKGFGALSDFRISFDEGVNVVMQPNGWGKTTLAAFIKAMLYGFDSKRVRDVMQNERLRYAPWSGGYYGGSLDFESGGREYRITRQFGKTASGDKEKIVDIETGERVDFMTPSAGEWLFGIDSEAFKKSVFIGQDAFEASWESVSLRNRLNVIVNDADDVGGLDDALGALDAQRKLYKKTGGRGRIAETAKEIASLVDAQKKAEEKISEVSQIGDMVKRIDEARRELSATIQTDRKRLDELKGSVSRREAQEQMRLKLKRAADEANKRLEEFSARQGAILPSEEEIGKAKRALELYEDELKRESGLKSTLALLADRRRVALVKFGGRIPCREELEERKERMKRLADVRRQLQLAEAKAATEPRRSFKAFRENPEAASRVRDVVAGWDEASAAADLLEKTEKEIAVARARWEEQGRRVREALDGVRAKRAAVPANPESKASEIEDCSKCLKQLDRERITLTTQRESLEARLCELSSLELTENAAELAAQLDDAVGRYSAADKALSEIKEKELGCSREKERCREERDRAIESSAQKQEKSNGAKRSPIALVISIAVAALLAVASFAVGLGSPASVALIAGAVLVFAAGLIVWARGSKSSESAADSSETSSRLLSEAQETYEEALRKEEAIRAEADAARSEANQSRQALEELLSRFPFAQGAESQSLLVRASMAKERASKQIEDAQKISELRESISRAAMRLKEIDEEIGRIRSSVVPLETDPTLPVDQLAADLDQRAVSIRRDAEAVRLDEERLVDLLTEVSGESKERILSDYEAAARAVVETPPRSLRELIGMGNELREVADSFAAQVSDCKKALSLPSDSALSIAEDVAVLREELLAYQQFFDSSRENEKKVDVLRRKAEDEHREMLLWAQSYEASFESAENGSLFEELDQALLQDDRMRWEEDSLKASLSELAERRSEQKKHVAALLGASDVDFENAREKISLLERAMRERVELEKSAESAKLQLEQWEQENASSAAAQNGSAQDSESAFVLEQRIIQNEQARDAAVKQIAQYEERKAALLNELESYLKIRQSVRVMSNLRQRDLERLFTIQKTGEYLARARANLDGRYLGDLADRFVDYADAWLDAEELDASVSEDFSVSMKQNGQTHSLASYSSGYRDLLGMCFRMALVDTLYEKEKPFLVMDDPFSLLDEGKVGRAFQLLDVVSERCQIIYFTCHPSRVKEMAAAVESGRFILPEQKARRELPRARARREAEERARAQRELVESFVVVPVSRGKASIVPESKRQVIANNLFSISFFADTSEGARDAEFTVSFIDEKGRVLCDRQSVSVVNGKVVPERVRFNLSTKEGSGRSYDLVIHEEGRAANELVARIPYKADISFTTDYFE